MSLKSIKIVTTAETLDTTYDTFLIDASNADITFTLSNITNNGENYDIKRIDNTNNVVTIKGFDTTQTIFGQPSIFMNSLDRINILAYNSIWY